MKLRNKKTGKIGTFVSTNWNEVAFKVLDENGVQLGKYTSLAELNAEWEDYEEPKKFYVIDLDGEILPSDFEDKTIEKSKELGNYFETKEAEKAVEKLKAWKRLKDKGFRFDDFVRNAIYFNLDEEQIQNKSILKDLDLLFGGEDEQKD